MERTEDSWEALKQKEIDVNECMMTLHGFVASVGHHVALKQDSLWTEHYSRLYGLINSLNSITRQITISSQLSFTHTDNIRESVTLAFNVSKDGTAHYYLYTQVPNCSQQTHICTQTPDNSELSIISIQSLA